MATIRLPTDFREFLKLCNEKTVEYLLVGGYVVNYYGYSRATGDMDVWVKPTRANAERVAAALRAFGFGQNEVSADLFDGSDRVVRLGMPPLRIEIVTSPSGVDFDECYARRLTAEVEGIEVPVLSLQDLLANKRAAGRHKDLDDVDHLE